MDVALAPTGKPGHRKDGWWARSRAFNLDAFRDPTLEQAYYLGYLLADGSTNGSQVQAASVDPELPYGLADAIGLDREAVKSYGQKENGKMLYVVRFSNPAMGWLLRPWGIVPNKTYEYVEPQVPEHLLAPYLRGMFDGDGWYSYWRSKHRTLIGSSWKFGFCGNEGVCDFWERGLRVLGYRGTIRRYKRTENLTEMIVGGRKQVEQVYLLLNGAPRLERKWGKLERTVLPTTDTVKEK